MKKTVSLLLIFTLCLTASVAVFAEASLPSYTFRLVDSGEGIVTLYVYSPADTVVNSGTVIFSYDKAVMTYQSSECSYFGEANDNYNRDGVTGIAFNFASTADIKPDSLLFTAVFKLAENASADVEAIKPEKWTMADGDDTLVNDSTENASIDLVQYYTVTIVDSEGSILGKVDVEKGASEITAPEIEGYEFVKWIDKPATITAPVTVTAEYALAYLLGDVNSDNKINAADASLVLQYNVKLIDFTDKEFKAAEVSGDGKISAGDASLILRYGVQLIDKFPIEDKQ